MKKMLTPRIWFVPCLAALMLTASGASSAQGLGQTKTDDALQAKLAAMAAVHQGKVSLYAEDLTTGKTVALDADTPVQTASVIKLTVLYDALKQIQAGRVHFDDKITLTHPDQVAGSGVLTFFDTPVQLTFKDALTLMIIMSDNTATNLAIDHLGLRNIDDQIVAMRLKNTWLYKKVYLPPSGPMPDDQKNFGLGKTTAREMATVMKKFVTCDLGQPATPAADFKAVSSDKPLCDAAMHMLKNQFYRNSIPRYLEKLDTTEGESAIANKTGALDATRNDVGVVFTRHGPIIISEFTNSNQDQSWTPDNDAEVLMAKLAKEIADDWGEGKIPALH
jgi:beta-lactamase class A